MRKKETPTNFISYRLCSWNENVVHFLEGVHALSLSLHTHTYLSTHTHTHSYVEYTLSKMLRTRYFGPLQICRLQFCSAELPLIHSPLIQLSHLQPFESLLLS